MTPAPNEREAEAAIPSPPAFSAPGLPILASAANSIPAFREAARQLPDLRSCPPGASLVAQVKSAMRGAAAEGHRHVFYSEPDKREFFLHGARAFLSAAREQN